MNKVMLIGNLTRDPEVRATQTGVNVCNFSIAVNRRKRADGVQETDFFNIVAWRQLADLCGKYLSKGRKVAVVGSIQTRTYEANDGTRRNAFDIVADEVEFLTPAGSASSSASEYHPPVASSTQSPAPAIETAPTYSASVSEVTQVDDDDLPF